MPFPVAAAIAGGVALAGQGAQMAATGVKNRKQFKRTKELMDKQDAMNRSMALFNQQQQMEMWENTGPSAQMEQLRKAGLNPGLIYGMGGAGGQTAQAAQAQGTSQPHYEMENAGEGLGILGAQMGEQLALMKAQKENIEADTQNKKATAEKTAGVDTELAKTNISSITQGISNQKATEELTKVQTGLTETQAKVASATAEQAISLVSQQSQIAEQTIRSLVRENAVNSRTAYDRIRMVNAELIGQLVGNTLTSQLTAESKSRVGLNDQQIKNLQNDISIRLSQKEQGWNTIEMNWNAINQKIRESVNQIRNADVTDREKMNNMIVENILRAF